MSDQNDTVTPAIDSETPDTPIVLLFPPWVLNLGFVFALLLAAASLGLSGWFLSRYLTSTGSGIEELIRLGLASDRSGPGTEVLQLALFARTVMARFALLSCGICAGAAFGSLGFALFLVGVRGEMAVEARHEQSQVKVARMAPGVFVIAVAAILIGVCATHVTEFSYGEGVAQAGATKETGRSGQDPEAGRFRDPIPKP